MPRTTLHPRIPFFPYAKSLQGARLQSLREEQRGQRLDLVMEYQEFAAQVSPDVSLKNGKLLECVHGQTLPCRLRFVDVTELQAGFAYRRLEKIPVDHAAREVRDMLHWIPAGRPSAFYLLFNSSLDQDSLSFFARRAVQEERGLPTGSFSLERDWSPPPPTRAGLIPRPQKVYERFGGDPVTLRFKAQSFHRRLFIGGLDVQVERRPDVDSVLNLGEEPSKWIKHKRLPASDRWVHKGEGVDGMSPDEILSEAGWVIERLQSGQRVLVHCVAGMNRSATICCAVLILLEGLTAEQALQRVRERHPWARPDSYHWLALRWLAKQTRAAAS